MGAITGFILFDIILIFIILPIINSKIGGLNKDFSDYFELQNNRENIILNLSKSL